MENKTNKKNGIKYAMTGDCNTCPHFLSFFFLCSYCVQNARPDHVIQTISKQKEADILHYHHIDKWPVGFSLEYLKYLLR